MYYETRSFQDLIEQMASCDKLGLMYVVQKDVREVEKWFGRKTQELYYKLQVIQYVEEVEEGEEISVGRPSESEEAPK